MHPTCSRPFCFPNRTEPVPSRPHGKTPTAENANQIALDDTMLLLDILSEDGGGDGTEDERDDAAAGGHHVGSSRGRGSCGAGLRALEASSRVGGLRGAGGRGRGSSAGQSWAGHGGVTADGHSGAHRACARCDHRGVARGGGNGHGRHGAWVAAG